jgi:hypothetical protein
MLKSLTRVIGEIRNGSGALSSAAAQVSATSQSARTPTTPSAWRGWPSRAHATPVKRAAWCASRSVP